MFRSQLLELFPIGPEFPDHRRCDPISATMAAVGAGTSIFSGITGASAAKKAAAAQAKAAQEASDKVGVAISDANRPIADATAHAQDLATAAGARSIYTAGQAANRVTDAAGQANLLLNPYADTGAQANAALSAEMGNFGRMPTLAELQMDPGYAFRLQQGELSLNRSAAAKGGVLSGETLKALTNYGQGAASQEYQNAFNRFRQTTQDRFSNLNTLAGRGQQAAEQQGNNLTGAAQIGGQFQIHGADQAQQANEYAGTAGMTGAGQMGDNTMRGAIAQGDYITQRGNAQASGYVGSANAWNGMAGGIGNAVTNGAMMNLLRNPATRNTTTIDNSSGFFR